jgi:hypothetical protein
MTTDQPQHNPPEVSETTSSTQSSRPPKNSLLNDAIGIAVGISVGWLGEIAMQSTGFALFAAK